MNFDLGNLGKWHFTRRNAIIGIATFSLASLLSKRTQSMPSTRDAVEKLPALSASDAVEALRDPIIRMSREVWQTAEISLEELESAQILIRELRDVGFKIEGPGVSGVPANFIAEWSQGNGGPIVGFMAEYDALPGLGNAAEPRQTPRTDGETKGHGCGHNLIGASCAGAGMALKAMMEATGTPGTVRVYGCAAEEAYGGKTYFARDGRFNDLDAGIAWHPATVAGAANIFTNANRGIRLQFIGQTAHAGVEPWEGRSALDAAELSTHAINMMREHVEPTARIHYIYEDGGQAPNVVPDTAAIMVLLREKDSASAEALADWTLEIAEGAAMDTQTKVNPVIIGGVADMVPNEPLAQRYHKYMNEVGLDWSEEEQEFARACQREGGVEENGLATEILPFIEEVRIGGSSDLGDVSWNAPFAAFVWPTYPQGFALHTWPVTAAGGMSIGDKASMQTANIMAATGFDVMTDPEFRASLRAEYEARTADGEYVNAIPPEMAGPIDVPEEILKTGNEDEIDAVI